MANNKNMIQKVPLFMSLVLYTFDPLEEVLEKRFTAIKVELKQI